jgi:Na+/melibiose symporter-like transporter
LLFKNRNFLVLWIGQLATIFGNRFSEIAVPLVVLQLTGSPWKAALIAVCSRVVPLALSLQAGYWVDRHSKKKIAMGADALSFMAMSALVLCFFFNVLNIWILAICLLVLGAAGLFYRVSLGAMLPSIAGRDQLVRAHNYIEGADAVSTLAGPVMAGAALSALGAAAVLGIDAVTYLISLAGLAVLTYKETPVAAKEREGFKNVLAVKEIKYLFINSYQRFISFHQAVLNFASSCVVLAVIFYTSQTLGFSEWQTGTVLSAAGAGNLLGVFLMNKTVHFSWKSLYGVLMAVSGLGLLLIMLSGQFAVIACGMFLFDGALSMAFVVNGSARQAITPDGFLARVAGGGILLSGLAAVSGTLFAGGIAESFHPLVVIAGCSVLLFLASAVSLSFKQGKSRLDKLEPISFRKKMDRI